MWWALVGFGHVSQKNLVTFMVSNLGTYLKL